VRGSLIGAISWRLRGFFAPLRLWVKFLPVRGREPLKLKPRRRKGRAEPRREKAGEAIAPANSDAMGFMTSRRFKLAVAMSLVVLAASCMIWIWSCWQPLVMPLAPAPGWRMVIDHGRGWVDDAPVLNETRELMSRLERRHFQFMLIQMTKLQEGHRRALNAWNRRRISWEEYNAYLQAENGDVWFMMRCSRGLGRGMPNVLSLSTHPLPSVWLIVVLSAVLPGIWLTRLLRSRRPHPGMCAACGYNLTGNTSGTCPECGVAIYKS